MKPVARKDDPGPAILPDLPREDGSPVFAEAWQAQAFAMTVTLYERGIFTWPEWAEHLSAEIKAAQRAGDPDLGDTYYEHWLRALEKLIAEKGILATSELSDRRDAWDRAARATPHGEPIVLGRECDKAEE